MKSFIQGEREGLQKADKALELIERKLEIAGNAAFVFPQTALKLRAQVEKHLEEYEQAKKELLEFWDMEEKAHEALPDKDHDWHPHETIY